MIDDLRVFPRTCFDGKPWYSSLIRDRPAQVGDHLETSEGWGIVVKISERRGLMYVRLAKLGPDLPPQEFPEFELMQHADALRQSRIAEGGWKLSAA